MSDDGPVLNWLALHAWLGQDQVSVHVLVPFHGGEQTPRFAEVVSKHLSKGLRGEGLYQVDADSRGVLLSFDGTAALANRPGDTLRITADGLAERARHEYSIAVVRDTARLSSWLATVLGQAPEARQMDVG